MGAFCGHYRAVNLAKLNIKKDILFACIKAHNFEKKKSF